MQLEIYLQNLFLKPRVVLTRMVSVPGTPAHPNPFLHASAAFGRWHMARLGHPCAWSLGS